MTGYQVLKAAVHDGTGNVCRRSIRQVAIVAAYPAFQERRVGRLLEQRRVVVALEQHGVAAF